LLKSFELFFFLFCKFSRRQVLRSTEKGCRAQKEITCRGKKKREVLCTQIFADLGTGSGNEVANDLAPNPCKSRPLWFAPAVEPVESGIRNAFIEVGEGA
jgi:hypothetical protein